MVQENNDLIQRIVVLEEQLKSKVSERRLWIILGPAILVGTTTIAALGYFDLNKIPQTIAFRIQEEIRASETEIIELIEASSEDIVEEQLSELFGEDYDRVIGRLSGLSMGVVSFPHASRPSGDKWQDLDRIEIKFSQEYDTIPNVFISLSRMEAYYRSPSPTFGLRVENASTTGFEIVISGAYLTSFSGASVNWMAVEPAFTR